MATIKSYTDLEQSKKLASILPVESADMYYCYGMNIYTKEWSFDDTPTIIDNNNQIDVHIDIPCWSLAALLNVIPEYNLQRTDWGYKTEYKIVVTVNEDNYASKNYDSPLYACIDMIIKLHELDLLNYDKGR